MRDEYSEFLRRKAVAASAGGFTPRAMNALLMDFQAASTDFAIRQGRAALYLSTGLGKSICQLEWSDQCIRETNKPALLLAPLAVAKQFERESGKFGYDAAVIRDMTAVGKRINIVNYDRLDKIDPSAFGSVSMDEASILKSYTGRTSRALIEAFAHVPYRLCATATPAPNDHAELGSQAEFLGLMTQAEMLVRWFINDTNDTGTWRLKGHARSAFYDWMASWSRMAETPADLGFDASRFILPPLNIIRHQVQAEAVAAEGMLFDANISATNMHDLKRQTAGARAGMIGDLVNVEPDHSWIIWCDTDYEADALRRVIPDAIEVRGSHTIERKEESLEAFAAGRVRNIITKPSVAGFGLNWQHADRMAFVGRSFSYEAWFQAVRRSWRFGQTNPVNVHLAVAQGEDQIGRVIDRKSEDHKTMMAGMTEAQRRNAGHASKVKVQYNPTYKGRMPTWLAT
jgi:hypothetical protein